MGNPRRRLEKTSSFAQMLILFETRLGSLTKDNNSGFVLKGSEFPQCASPSTLKVLQERGAGGARPVCSDALGRLDGRARR